MSCTLGHANRPPGTNAYHAIGAYSLSLAFQTQFADFFDLEEAFHLAKRRFTDQNAAGTRRKMREVQVSSDAA